MASQLEMGKLRIGFINVLTMETSSVSQPLLRVLQVNTRDLEGGAARIAWDLFQSCQNQNFDSWLAVGYRRSHNPSVFQIPHQTRGWGWSNGWWKVNFHLRTLSRRVKGAFHLSRLARKLAVPKGWVEAYQGIEDFNFPGSWQLLHLPPKPPTLIHCHNLHGEYFDLRALSWLSQQVPVVLTLHDAWLLSGHCAHSLECDRWQLGCGHCPDLTLYPSVYRDATAFNWQRKQVIYQKSQLYVATPSQWLMQKVEASMLAPAIVESRVIPNGVDLSLFHPGDKILARNSLGISLNASVLLFTANSIRRNIWKDYQTLQAAVRQVADSFQGQKLIFIALGEKGAIEQLGKAEIHFVPFQSDPKLVAQYYQAADIYLHAAKADTFPTTVLEALACGVPVIATAVGGIPEQIQEGDTGFLIPPGQADLMAARIQALLDRPELHQHMCMQAAQYAQQHFSMEQMVNAYVTWYQEILKKKKS